MNSTPNIRHFCHMCGTKNTRQGEFCTNCGANLVRQEGNGTGNQKTNKTSSQIITSTRSQQNTPRQLKTRKTLRVLVIGSIFIVLLLVTGVSFFISSSAGQRLLLQQSLIGTWRATDTNSPFPNNTNAMNIMVFKRDGTLEITEMSTVTVKYEIIDTSTLQISDPSGVSMAIPISLDGEKLTLSISGIVVVYTKIK